MFYEDDLDIFFSDFALKGIYKTKTIPVILDFNYTLAVNRDGFPGVEVYDYIATVKSKDVEGIKHNDVLEVSGKTYYVKGIQDTAMGFTMLFLSEQD